MSAGSYWGWPELAVPGAVVGAVFLVGLVFSLRQPRLEVKLEGAHRRIAVGGDPEVQLVVTNRGARSVWGSQVRLWVGDRQLPVRLGRLTPSSSVQSRVSVPTNRRAVLRIGPVTAVCGDPLGLVARVWSWGQPLEVAVYPPTVTVPVAWPGIIRDLEGQPTGQPAPADVSFHALREYVPGDDIRSIHWRSTARLGQLVVRESEDARRVQMALLLATTLEEYAHQRDFELAVAVYASLGLAQIKRAGSLALMRGGVLWHVGHIGPFLDHTAALSLGPSGAVGGSLMAAASRLRSEVPGATLVLLITGVAEIDLPRMAALLPRGAAVLAVYCQEGAASSIRPMGRWCGVTVGALEDLPLVLARLGLQ